MTEPSIIHTKTTTITMTNVEYRYVMSVIERLDEYLTKSSDQATNLLFGVHQVWRLLKKATT